MNLMHIVFFLIYACCSITSTVHGQDCEKITQLSGHLSSGASNPKNNFVKCWFIEVPQNTYVQIELKEFYSGYSSYGCGLTEIELLVNGANQVYKFCPNDANPKPIIAFRDVKVRYSHWINLKHPKSSSSCLLWFTKGISSVNETNESRINATNWLMNHQKDYGWGKNTHRAVTALYLTNATKFVGHNVMGELIVKQLQMKTAASLLRNFTEPMSVNELSMYVNSLLVTCHDVRNIFKEDLLGTLASRTFSSSSVSPGAYLTLCNANWKFSERNVQQLLSFLTKDIQYPFAFELQAMTIMTLSCLNQKTSLLQREYNASSIYNKTIQNFMSNQKKYGSFGNVHTTAVVMQALISSKHAGRWNIVNATSFLMKNLNTSSVDFLTVYLTLPLFEGKTLVDISNAHCSDHQRKLEDDEDILVDKLNETIQVEYSLYVGDNKNLIDHLYLKVPENSTVYDVMKIAETADPKYKFSHHQSNGHVYIYRLAGLTNDLEAGKVWMLYIIPKNDTELNQFMQSPDQITLKDKEHLIMWYKYTSI